MSELEHFCFFATFQNFFLSDGSNYSQMDGLAMILLWHFPGTVIVFLGYHETKRLINEQQLKDKLYLIYVNEVLFTFTSEQKSLHFLNVLNNKGPNNKFMMEKSFWVHLSQGLTLMKSNRVTKNIFNLSLINLVQLEVHHIELSKFGTTRNLFKLT